MTTCPSCEKQISSEALTCPGCGHPVKKSQGDEISAAVVSIVVGVGGLYGLYWIWKNFLAT